MKRTERLGSTIAPDGTRLDLLRHDGEFSIRAHGQELMSSRRHYSEDVMAAAACESLTGMSAPTLLIGGLGLGFTLRAALPLLPKGARVVVAELLEDVIAWHRDPVIGLRTAALDDPRVDLRLADVAALLRGPAGQYDAVALDVDNGAEAFTTASNSWLYTGEGVACTRNVLAPGGRAVWWLESRDRSFESRVRGAGFGVEHRAVSARGGRGPAHALLVAIRP